MSSSDSRWNQLTSVVDFVRRERHNLPPELLQNIAVVETLAQVRD
jgi:uncharacterized protein YfkK (UPF0435 family)